MTAVYVIATILLSLIFLVGIIMLIPVKLILKSEENNLKILIKVLFFKIDPNELSNEEEKQNKPQKKNEKKEFKERIENVKLILKKVKAVLKKLGSILRVMKLEKLNLKFISGGEDAVKSAINYGIACSVIYPVISHIQSAMKVRRKRVSIDVGCVFENVPYEFNFEAVISIKIFHLLVKGFDIYKTLKAVDENEQK